MALREVRLISYSSQTKLESVGWLQFLIIDIGNVWTKFEKTYVRIFFRGMTLKHTRVSLFHFELVKVRLPILIHLLLGDELYQTFEKC